MSNLGTPRRLSRTATPQTGAANQVPLVDAGEPWNPELTGLQFGAKVVVALALLTDYLLLTMPIPIMPLELSCQDGRLVDDGACVSDSWIFFLFASKAIFQIVANPVMGWLVDRKGPLVPLRVSLVLMSISTAGFAIGLWLNHGRASTAYVVFPLLFAARSVQGLCSGGVMTAGMALVNQVHRESERGTAAGVVMSGMALGVLAGPIFAGVIAEFWTSWGAFLIIAALILLGAVLQTAFLMGKGGLLTPKVPEPEGPSYWGVYCDPLVLTVGACTLLAMTGISLMEPLVPLYLSRPPFNYGPLAQAGVWSCSTLAYIISTPIAGMLADSIPEWWLLLSGLLMLAVGAAFVVLVPELWVTIVALVFVGGAMGFIDTPSSPLLAKIADLRGGAAYGGVFAVMDMSASLGFVLGPALAAAIQSSGAPIEAITAPVAVVAVLFTPFLLCLRQLRPASSGTATDMGQSLQPAPRPEAGAQAEGDAEAAPALVGPAPSA